jgi:rhodanese-related sulfurtransferase
MAVNEITKEELKRLLQNSPEKPEIIDVRESDEYEVIRLKNSKLIPMSEFQNRMDEIDWKKEVIFLCRHGIRSAKIAELAVSHGKNGRSLKDGIYACYQDKERCLDNIIMDEVNVKNYF